MWYQRKGNKYNAKSHIYNGISYHSKREAAYAQELDLLKKSGEIKDWQRQIKISLDVNGYHIANYYCDFLIINPDDSQELHEVKSSFTLNLDVYRIKRKLMEATYLHEHPEIKYVVIV